MRADRLLSVVMLLRHRGRMTAAELAAELEVSERTVLRDIDALSVAGVPVYAERGRSGGFALLPGYRTDLTGLTLDESRALMASGAGRIGSPALAAAMRKVAAAIPDTHRAVVDSAARRVLVRPEGFVADGAVGDDLLADLQRAVMVGLRVRMRYARRDTPVAERLVDPVGLVMAGETWYLVALRGGETDERIYRVSRIESLAVLDEPARRPDDVDLDAIWDRRRTEFRGRFEPVAVIAVVADDHVLPDGIRSDVTELGPVDDGRRRIRLDFGDRRYAEAALWRMAPEIVVESPTELRDALTGRAAALLAAHGQR
ncbi:WYL domain-containing protein [uncultured Williamsia sp.]|uniref:helix-turn-helix transcriptional regulator n=1 Tax=uncultured Williamsia sp. TaxID=259311 RepID=UPI002606C91F|nr:WYL domain-containing protein [uncultured Williamsia sp.]